MSLIDLSPPVSTVSPHWPGDHGFSRNERWSIAGGETVNVATVTTTGHIGSHIDAPSHVVEGGASSEHTSLEAGIGPCLVLDVTRAIDRGRTPHGFAPSSVIREQLLALRGSTSATQDRPIERILLRHRTTAPHTWYENSPGLDPEFVRWFGEQGGLLIGVDLDSFDSLDSKDLPAHRAAVDSSIVILEGLDLARAPEGNAELIALPAHWVGSDAVPVRAVLRM